MDGEITTYPTDGVLDLHTFHPKDAADVTKEYLQACHKEGICYVRIIHGKGTGTLRNTVHRVLERLTIVDYWQTPTDQSGWGATIVTLKNQVD